MNLPVCNLSITEDSLSFVLSVKSIASVNEAYTPTVVKSKGRVHAFLRLSSTASKYKSSIVAQLRKILKGKVPKWLNKTNLYTFNMVVLMNKSPLDRDLDNTCKLTQDAIFNYVGINDSHVIDLVMRKVYKKKLEKELIVVTITLNHRDLLRGEL